MRYLDGRSDMSAVFLSGSIVGSTLGRVALVGQKAVCGALRPVARRCPILGGAHVTGRSRRDRGGLPDAAGDRATRLEMADPAHLRAARRPPTACRVTPAGSGDHPEGPYRDAARHGTRRAGTAMGTEAHAAAARGGRADRARQEPAGTTRRHLLLGDTEQRY